MSLALPLPQSLQLVLNRLGIHATGNLIVDSRSACDALGLDFLQLMHFAGLIGVVFECARLLNIHECIYSTPFLEYTYVRPPIIITEASHYHDTADYLSTPSSLHEEDFYYESQTSKKLLQETNTPARPKSQGMSGPPSLHKKRRDTRKIKKKKPKQRVENNSREPLSDFEQEVANGNTESILFLFRHHKEAFSANTLAIAIHRIARMKSTIISRVKKDKDMLALIDTFELHVLDCNPQDLAKSARALVDLGITDRTLFTAIGDSALHQMNDFMPSAFSDIAMAFALIGFKLRKLFGAIAHDALSSLHNFTPTQLNNLLWAFTTLALEAKTLFTVSADLVQTRLDDYTLQDISSTVWCMARSRIYVPQLFTAVAHTVIAQFDTYTLKSPDISNIVWAFATLGTFEEEGLLQQQKDASTPSIVTRMFAAFAQTITVSAILDTFNLKALAHTAWAYACISWPEYDFFIRLLTAAAAKILAASSPEKNKTMSKLYQVILYLRLIFPDERNSDDCPLLTPFWHKKLLKAHCADEQEPISQVQKSVTASLDRIGWNHKSKHLTAQGLLLDIAQPATMIAIKLDTPSQYLKEGNTFTEKKHGASLFKCRLLRDLGWTIIHIPFYHWQWLRGQSSEEDAFLRQKLASFVRRDSDTTLDNVVDQSLRPDAAITLMRKEAPIEQQILWGKQISSKEGAHSERILSLLQSHGQQFSARNLAAAAYCLAKIWKESKNMLYKDVRVLTLFHSCRQHVLNFNAQDLALTAWAFAVLDIQEDAQDFFNVIADLGLKKLSELNPQSISSITWAFATVHVDAPVLFRAIADVSLERLGDFNLKWLASTAKAFAIAEIEAIRLFEGIADIAIPYRNSFTEEDLSDILWAFACVEWSKSNFFIELLTAAVAALDTFTTEELANLYQVLLYLRSAFPDIQSPVISQQEKLRSAFLTVNVASAQIDRHRVVSESLNRIGWGHELEYTTPDGFVLDIAQPTSKTTVRLVTTNTELEKEKDGASCFKSKLLSASGWTLIDVPSCEWDSVRGEQSKEAAFLRLKLRLL